MELTWADSVKKLEGQKAAVYCVNIEYRGVLREVYSDHIILNPAAWVKVPGWNEEDGTSDEEPKEEYPIENGIVLPKQVIETIYQPKWSQAPLHDPLEDALPKRVKGKECSFTDTMQQFKGLRFVVIGTGYLFRGILRDTQQDHIVLEDAIVHERQPTDIRPDSGVSIRAKLIMNLETISGFYQPKYLTSWDDA
jgi:hypothetical protein